MYSYRGGHGDSGDLDIDAVRNDLTRLNIPQIKSLLAQHRAPVTGNKSVLVQRLITCMHPQAAVTSGSQHVRVHHASALESSEPSQCSADNNDDAESADNLEWDCENEEHQSGESRENEDNTDNGVVDDLSWGDGLQASKFKSLGTPKRRTVRIHGHLQKDNLFMTYVAAAVDMVRKAKSNTGAVREGIDLQFERAPQHSEAPQSVSEANDVEARKEAQRAAYAALVPLFIVAVFFYYDTELDPYAPLFTWNHVGWFLSLYCAMPKKKNSKGRDVEGASPSMLSKLQMVMNGMYVRERQMFNSWQYLRNAQFEFKDKYFAESYDNGKPAVHDNPRWDNPLRAHRVDQQASKMNNAKPAADTLLNACRLNRNEFFGIIHHLVSNWTESSVRSAAFLAVSFSGAVRGDSLKSTCFKNVLHKTISTGSNLEDILP